MSFGFARTEDTRDVSAYASCRATNEFSAEYSAIVQEHPVSDLNSVPPSPDDLDVARALAGDRDAFAALYKRHRGVVIRVVCRMGVPRADLEDTIQEVFVQVHRSLRDFRAQAKFSTWLHRISVNVVLMQRRALKSRPQYAPEPEVEVAGVEALPDDDAERRERLRAFDRMLEKIAEKKRTVFMLHDIEGMSPQEIAEIVDAPVLTVRTRLFYARRELEALLPSEPALAAVRGAFSKPALDSRTASVQSEPAATATGVSAEAADQRADAKISAAESGK
jgi:RNA polymerase sigma-70 factor, ECF subfamily